MRKKYVYLLILSIVISQFLVAQKSVELDWAYKLEHTGGSGGAPHYSTIEYVNGFVYGSGSLKGTVDMDPGTGVYTMISDDSRDGFIEKLDIDGNLIWAIRIGGIADQSVLDMKVDDSLNIYIVGSFSDSTYFDPSSSIVTIPVGDNGGGFIAKYDSVGNFKWVHTIGSNSITSTAGLICVDVDNNQNPVVGGSFSGTDSLKLDSGLTSELTLYLSEGGYDGILLKFDPAGALLWSNVVAGLENDQVLDVGCDGLGNIGYTGYFKNSITFSTGSSTVYNSLGVEDIFLQKVNSSGTELWTKTFGNTGQDKANSICVEDTAIYIVGGFSDSISFSSFSAISMGGSDGYITCFDNLGNVNWVNFWRSTATVDARQVKVFRDQVYVSNNLRATGYFNSDNDTAVSAGSIDACLQSYQLNGDFNWVNSFGGPQYDALFAFEVDENYNIYLGGAFKNTTDFDPNLADTFLLASVERIIYIAKWRQCGLTRSETGLGCNSYLSSGGTTYTSSGLYSEPVLNYLGCYDTLLLDLTIKPVDISVTNSSPTLFSNSLNGSYQWYNCTNMSIISGETGPSFTSSTNGSFAVIVVENGCQDTSACEDIVHKIEVSIPNIFTPNQDGFNDLFKLSTNERIKSMTMEIYNRWGQLIYESNLINEGWDGYTNSGSQVSSGTYFYVINIENESSFIKKYNGTLTLIR